MRFLIFKLITLLFFFGNFLNANKFSEEMAKHASMLMVSKSFGGSFTKEGLKKVTRALNRSPVTSKKYYKNGNIKEKIQTYKNLISSKYSYKIITQYYDDDDASVSKSGFYIENEVIMEAIISNDGREKCSTEYSGLNEKVESMLEKFTEGSNDREGYKFNENYIKDLIRDSGIEKTADALAVLPSLILTENNKKIKCKDTIYFIFGVKYGDIVDLDYAGRGYSDVTTTEKAMNLVNKYYKTDPSIKDRVHNLKKDLVDFFK